MLSILFILIVIFMIIIDQSYSFQVRNKIVNSNLDFNVDKKELINLSFGKRKYSSNTRRKYQLVTNSIIETSSIATDGFTYAFVGGTVGVMFTMFALEWKKTKDKSLEGCPYCMGNGEILCASCNGAAFGLKAECTCCNGRGLILCINCKGDGRLTPIILQSRNVRDPEFGASDNLSPDAP